MIGPNDIGQKSGRKIPNAHATLLAQYALKQCCCCCPVPCVKSLCQEETSEDNPAALAILQYNPLGGKWGKCKMWQNSPYDGSISNMQIAEK